MTVSTTDRVARYVGNGSTATFDYPFKIIQGEDLVVSLDDGPPGAFTISGVGEESGGAVTFSTPPASGARVTLLRVSPLQQLHEYDGYGDFASEAHEQGLDRRAMVEQELTEEVRRCLQLARSDDIILNPLPYERASQWLGFDANRQVIVGTPTDLQGLPTTAWSQGLLTMASAEDARRYLGVGGNYFIPTGLDYTGATDSSAAFNAALVACAANSGTPIPGNPAESPATGPMTMLLSAGTLLIATPLIYREWGRVKIKGPGMAALRILCAPGLTGSLFETENFATKTGSADQTYHFTHIGLEDLRIDGNKANRSAQGQPLLRFFAKGISLKNVYIENSPDTALYTEWAPMGPVDGWWKRSEADIDNLVIFDTNGDGWVRRGIHDGHIGSVYLQVGTGTGMKIETAAEYSGVCDVDKLYVGLFDRGLELNGIGIKALDVRLENCQREGLITAAGTVNSDITSLQVLDCGRNGTTDWQVDIQGDFMTIGMLRCFRTGHPNAGGVRVAGNQCVINGMDIRGNVSAVSGGGFSTKTGIYVGGAANMVRGAVSAFQAAGGQGLESAANWSDIHLVLTSCATLWNNSAGIGSNIKLSGAWTEGATPTQTPYAGRTAPGESERWDVRFRGSAGTRRGSASQIAVGPVDLNSAGEADYTGEHELIINPTTVLNTFGQVSVQSSNGNPFAYSARIKSADATEVTVAVNITSAIGITANGWATCRLSLTPPA